MNDRDLFIAALQLNAGEERAAYLTDACGTDQERRQRIEKLLRRHEESESFLNPDHVERTAAFELHPSLRSDHPALESAGDQIGPFKLLQKLGDGGMGTVWVAEQEKPVKRRVALKLVKAGMDSAEVLRRFEAERQALAMMDHTNIAKVFDAGTNAQGRPYFVMELIKGVPITKYCDEVHASIRDRLDLFIQICSAVQHAHQKGIIHRDIKPSNVLVAMQDGKPVPKVIDFGVAKALHSKLADKTMYTEIGQVVGTLEYMAPEQAELSAMDIDTRADIYALGILLYELLTGSTPITRQRIKSAAFAEVLRIIKEEEPPKPSTRLSESKDSMASVASLRRTDPKHLSSELRGELDWVVLKALEKDRTRRYETANGLSRDLQRYLANETVEARPPSAGYRLRKFVKRNKTQVGAAGLVLTALVMGIIGIGYGFLQAEASRRDAVAAAVQASDERLKAETAKALAEAQRVKAEKARDRTRDVLDAMTSGITGYSLATQTAVSADQKKFLTEVLTYYREFAGEKAEDEQSRARSAAAAYRVGYIENRLGRSEQALVAFQTASDGYGKLATDFPSNTEYRYEQARSLNNMGLHLRALGKRLEAAESHRRALAISDKLVAESPTVPKYRREQAGYHTNLGHLLTNPSETEEHFRKALAKLESLVAEFPTDPDFRRMLAHSNNNLGLLLANLRRLPEAENHIRKTFPIREKLYAEFPTTPDYAYDLAQAHSNLANLLNESGKRPEAQTELQKAVAILEKLSADFPASPAYPELLAANLIRLAMLTASMGKPESSSDQIRKALAILEKLAVDSPVVPQYRQALASGHGNLASLLTDLGKRSEAQAEHDKALAVLEKLSVDFPAENGYLQLLANGHTDMGILLQSLGKSPLAEEHYRKAMAIRQKLAAESPTLSTHQIALGGSYCNLGMSIRDGGRPLESLEWFDNAIRTLQPVHDKEPRDVTAKQFLRNSHSNRAIAYDRLQKFVEAVKDHDRAIELSLPAEQAGNRAARASSRVQAGMIAEAVAEVAELTKSSNWNAGQWYDFARVYAIASTKIADKKQEYADRAMELLQHAVKAGYKDAAHLAKDSDLDPLRNREDFKKLLADLTTQATPSRSPADSSKK